MVLATVIIAYLQHSQQQALLKIKSLELANHAAQAADAFRVLKVEPQSEYERYRALFHLRSFKVELSNLASFVQSQTYVTASDQMLVQGELDENRVTKLSESLFEAEQALAELSNRKFIGKSNIREVLSKIEVE